MYTEGHSRIPIFYKDKSVKYLLLKDLCMFHEEININTLSSEFLNDPLIINEKNNILSVLHEFQKSRRLIGVVVNNENE